MTLHQIKKYQLHYLVIPVYSWQESKSPENRFPTKDLGNNE